MDGHQAILPGPPGRSGAGRVSAVPSGERSRTADGDGGTTMGADHDGDLPSDATVADYLVARLAEWGVHRYHGYPGDGINGMTSASRRGVPAALATYRPRRRGR
ncbi:MULTISPECIES: hypothetical protein [unclassified Micromonospora]|uniref:hypothetical protein n=1 Tax=unclassified Micromonospora TaxID=2617518 RepID=UPI001C23CB02|nr:MULTISPECIES: hypothetical protein [unclassified Micromonospora]MBU8855935.1 hypothetical protein [Micromonospora sp. WMMB482]MDM4781540.1 hypothetical protein [Micromonospora sp. b486]